MSHIDYSNIPGELLSETRWLCYRLHVTLEDFAVWINLFFSGTDGGSLDNFYNVASGNGFKETENILKRHAAMLQHYKEYIKN